MKQVKDFAKQSLGKERVRAQLEQRPRAGSDEKDWGGMRPVRAL